MVKENPILIVGAGPVGLCLALALGRQGVAVHVFEQLPDLSPEARASTIHPSTLEMLAEWGVIDEVLPCGSTVRRMQFWERQTRTLIAEFDYAAIAGDTAYPYRLQCPQSILSRVLKAHLDRHYPHVQVHMGWRLEHFIDHGTHVTAHLFTPDGAVEMAGSYLCAADGSKSTVRQQLGLSFEGMTYEDRFLLVATDAHIGRLFHGLGPVSYMFDPHEWVIVLHLPEVTRVVFRLRDDESREDALQQAALIDRLRRFLNADTLSFNIIGASVYAVHQRVAERFRDGRVLLLGDAAHINNPMGGMGMNSGIHDAMHLARAFMRVQHGEPDSALDDYAEARRAYALHHIREYTHQQYRDMASADPQHRALRDQSMRDIAQDPQRMRQYLLKASMFDDHFSPSPTPPRPKG
jgi:3-(3-hydroxy-phenyl)propionate hydroxylase